VEQMLDWWWVAEPGVGPVEQVVEPARPGYAQGSPDPECDK